MTAKEYLGEIRRMDIKISQKQREYDMLLGKRAYINAVAYSERKGNADFTKTSNRILDMQQELNEDIDRFVNMRNYIIKQIQELKKTEYMEILFKRYVEYKRFELIACEMKYSYDRTVHMHMEALNRFEDMFLETRRTGRKKSHKA